MTPLTLCSVTRRCAPQALRMSAMIRGMAWASFVAILCLFHLYIKFAALDYKTSAAKVQDQCADLRDQIKKARRDVASLEYQNGGETRQLVEEWGMRMADDSQMIKGSVPDAYYRQYANKQWRRPDPNIEMNAPRSSNDLLERLVAGVAARLGESSAYGGQ